MSRPGPHVEEAELVPADQRAARAPASLELPPTPKQRVNRAADALVAVVRLEVANGRATCRLEQALDAFDKAAKIGRQGSGIRYQGRRDIRYLIPVL